MFKRFQFMNLFHTNYNLRVEEWVDVKINIPSQEDTICKVKLSNSNEIIAYFCSDKCANLVIFLGIEPTYWWDKQSGHPLYNVTHWGKNEMFIM